MTCYCERESIDTSYGGNSELPIGPDDEVVVIFGSRAYDSVRGSISSGTRLSSGPSGTSHKSAPQQLRSHLHAVFPLR